MSDPLIEPLVLADHPALDLLNTQALVDGQWVDFWQSDADVQAWLARMGLEPASTPRFATGALLDAAKVLREAVRGLVEKRKSGERGDPAALNRFLAAAVSHPRLVWDSVEGPRLERVSEANTVEQALAPLSELAAQLLGEGDFNLVRQCEHPDCVLWFYDRTKSHRRRWCSMALCGNRHKVAEHRKRQRGE